MTFERRCVARLRDEDAGFVEATVFAGEGGVRCCEANERSKERGSNRSGGGRMSTVEYTVAVARRVRSRMDEVGGRWRERQQASACGARR